MHLMKDTNVHLENRKLSRVFFVFLFLLYSLVCMTKNCFSGALAAIVAEGTLSISQTTFITAAFYIVYTPLQIIGGVLADKYSTARLVLIGLLGSAVCNIVIFFNQNYYVMLTSWVFSAIVQSALWPAVFKMYSSQLVRSDRGTMIFFMSFASSMGFVFSYLVAAVLTRWQLNFAVSAVVLLVLAVILLVFCHKIDPSLKRDTPIATNDHFAEGETPKGKQVIMLFLSSGFIISLFAVLLRYIVDNSGKTFTPTMLAQSYADISPSIGNLLTILVVVSGILGTLIVRFLLYPRIFKNEFTCSFALLLVALPFTVLMRFVGTIPPALCVLSLCVISLLSTGTGYLASCFAARFVKFRLNGTAAGLLNAAYSFALVLQYIILGKVAENYGWDVVTTLWIIMIVLSILLFALAIRPSIRFKRTLH